MKWFKIVLDKTGAILSCDEVAAALDGTKLVRYVEAQDKAGACADVKAWYSHMMELKRAAALRHRVTRLARGICEASGCKNPTRPGRTTCQECADRKVAHSAERRRRRREGDHVNLSLHPGGPEAVRRADQDRSARWALKRKLEFGSKSAYRHHLLLKKFDALGPVAFRAWLVSKIPSEQAAAKVAEDKNGTPMSHYEEALAAE